MPKSKRCIVFATYKSNKESHEHLEFYALDEDFNPVENEKELELSLDKACGIIQISDPSLIATPLSVQKHCHTFESYASLGDRVYRAGGSYSGCGQCKTLAHLRPETPNTKVASMRHIILIFSRYVDCWDPINNCWTVLPPLNVGRPSPKLHILQDKLFAVGGYESCDEFRFIEMFDESSHCWISHSYSPSIVKLDCTRFVSAAVEQEGFILFGSYADDRFYAFWPISGTWKRMDYLPFDHDMLLIECLESPTVVVGNHLLWLDCCVGSTLVGFNIYDGSYFRINLASEGLLPSSESIQPFYPYLLRDENGELALVWRDCCYYVLEGTGKGLSKDSRKESSAGIHCCRFSIDFHRAHKGDKCCVLMSHTRCIGSNVADDLGAAFVAEVGVAVGIASTSNNISRILPPPKRGGHFKRALQRWCSGPDQSIWWEIIDNDQRSGQIFGMSDYFRGGKGMKPIFEYAYRKIFIEQVYTSLVQNILADGEGLTVIDSDGREGSAQGYRHMISILRYIVVYVVGTELPFGSRSNYPAVYHKFTELCDLALDSWDPKKLRNFSYFICKNPIVFGYRDGMHFFDKCWNMREMDTFHFDREVKMKELDDYLYVIGYSHKALYDIKLHGQDIHYNEEHYTPQKYYSGPTCFHYFINVKREYPGEELNSLQDIFIMIALVFPSVLPTAFYEMTKRLFVENKFKGFATCSQ